MIPMKRTLAAVVIGGVLAFGAWAARAAGQGARASTPAAKPAATAAQQAAPNAKFGPHKQTNFPPLPFGPRDPVPRPANCVNRSSQACVADVFKFAAEHPEVLGYVPCFCGCEHLGHRGNDDCFVKARAANGDVVAWEPHGTECQVCLDVGQQAMQMYSSGASVREIRAAIEKKYSGTYHNHTPTAAPPAK